MIIISTVLLILIFSNSKLAFYFSLFLTYGFLARTSSGPKVSPLALIVTKAIVPNLNFKEKLVPGPPKRFAQSIGLFMSSCSSLFLFLELHNLAIFFISVLIFFASLEAFLGFCFGCKVFKFLIYLKVIPESVCEKCNNLEF